MPFTPTHLAAALPIWWLSRGRLPLTPLAIGCVVCDLPVFFPMLISYNELHSMRGVVTHSLPIGLVLYLLYHAVYKRPFALLLPCYFSARAARWFAWELPRTISQWFWIAISIMIGASSHVLWDSFTHGGRWGVRLFPVLNETALVTADGPLPWYQVLQHGSTLLLLPPVILGSLIWLSRQPSHELPEVKLLPSWFKGIAILFAVAVACLSLVYVQNRYPHGSVLMVLHVAAKIAGAICILAGTLYAFLLSLFLPSLGLLQLRSDVPESRLPS